MAKNNSKSDKKKSNTPIPDNSKQNISSKANESEDEQNDNGNDCDQNITIDNKSEVEQKDNGNDFDKNIAIDNKDNDNVETTTKNKTGFLGRLKGLFKGSAKEKIIDRVKDIMKEKGDDSFDPSSKSTSELLDYLLENTVSLYSSQKEIENKDNEIEVLNEAKNTLQQEKYDLENVKDSLESEKSNLENAKATLETEKSKLQNAKVTLEREKSELQNAKATLEREKSELQNANNVLETEKSKLQNAKNVLETEKSKLQNAKVTLEREKSELQNAKATLEREKSELQNVKATLEREKSDLETDKGDLEGKLKEISESDNAVLIQERNALNGKIGELEEIIKQREDTITEEVKKKNDFQEQLRAKEEKLGDANNTIIKKESQITELNKTINVINQKIGEANNEIAQLSQTVDNKEKRIEVLNQNIVTLGDTIKSKNDEIEKLNGHVVQLNNTIRTKDSEIVGLNGKVAQLSNTISTKDIEIGQLNGKLENKEKEKQAVFNESRNSIKFAVASVNKDLDSLSELLGNGDYLFGDANIMDDCKKEEKTTIQNFSKIADAIRTIDTSAFKNVSEYYAKVRECIMKDLDKGEFGLFLSLARLCAYAKMPFMREERGEDDYVLNYPKLSDIQTKLEALLSKVGVSLIVPIPFCDSLNDGPFEHSPNSVPNLDYICPNSRQWLSKIPRQNVNNIITDIVSIGYRTEDGKEVKAKVLI